MALLSGHFNMFWIQKLLANKILHSDEPLITNCNAICPGWLGRSGLIWVLVLPFPSRLSGAIRGSGLGVRVRVFFWSVIGSVP